MCKILMRYFLSAVFQSVLATLINSQNASELSFASRTSDLDYVIVASKVLRPNTIYKVIAICHPFEHQTLH